MPRNAQRVAVTETNLRTKQILVERIREELDTFVVVENRLLEKKLL